MAAKSKEKVRVRKSDGKINRYLYIVMNELCDLKMISDSEALLNYNGAFFTVFSALFFGECDFPHLAFSSHMTSLVLL